MNEEPARDLCAELLDLVRHLRSDITWLELHCETQQRDVWLWVHMSLKEREIRFGMQIPDSQLIGIFGMATRLIEEAERWLVAEGLS